MHWVTVGFDFETRLDWARFEEARTQPRRFFQNFKRRKSQVSYRPKIDFALDRSTELQVVFVPKNCHEPLLLKIAMQALLEEGTSKTAIALILGVFDSVCLQAAFSDQDAVEYALRFL